MVADGVSGVFCGGGKRAGLERYHGCFICLFVVVIELVSV
jgi:hypothetical protein